MDPTLSFLADASTDFLANTFLFVIIPFLYFGMALPIFIYASIILMRRGFDSNASKIITVAGIIGFSLMVINLAAGIHAGSANIQLPYLFASQGRDGVDFVNDAQKTAIPMQDTTNGLSLYLSDAIVVWRASKLLHDRPKSILLLLVMWTAGIGCLIASIVTEVGWQTREDYEDKYPLSQRLVWANCLISLLVNSLATGLMFHKLWKENRALDKRGRIMPAFRAMSILVETGAAFCIYQILDRLLDFLFYFSVIPEILSTIVIYNTIDQGTYSFGAVYPVLMVVLVDLDRAAVESSFWDSQGNGISGETNNVARKGT